MLGAGGVAKPTYLDDVFNTDLWTGTGNSQTITNGIDLTKGGLVWTKVRNINDNHALMDSTSKTGTYYDEHSSSSTYALTTSRNWGISSLNNNGFTLGGSNNQFNYSGGTHASWSFRRASGFFDVVTWTGDNGGERNISHSLGSNIGMIIAKRTDTAATWHVWHRDLPNLYSLLELNNTQAVNNGSDAWGYPSQDGGPVINSSSFSVDNRLNDNNATYVAYVFAGGEDQTTATARSVLFTGTSHKLSLAASDDFHLTGDFTIEGWFYPTGESNEHIWSLGTFTTSGGVLCYIYSNKLYIQEWISGTRTDRLLMDPAPPQKQWSHIAIVRSGSTINAYVNGTLIKSWTYSDDYGSSSNKTFYIAGSAGSHGSVNISNFRVVKGTAVYTSSFRPPTVPLTNITNTKLLCCNNSSATGSTVTPGTITASGTITTSTDSPFDDPAGFVFGENKDQNVIKCGSYKGSGSAGLEVNLGFEPQWLLIKEIDASNRPWVLFDSMRGIVDGGEDMELNANSNGDESTGNNRIKLTSTGFQFETSHGDYNGSSNYVYIAIRRPDPLVQKPAELGTGVFAMDTGNGSSTIPAYDSGFPVDFAFARRPTATDPWYTSARLMNGKFLETDANSAQQTSSNFIFDSNNGWAKSHDSAYQSWMWKRHAGFDVVNGLEENNSHNLGRAPEMVWVKRRSSTSDWFCWHKGLNGGGSNAVNYHLRLNTNAAESSVSSLCPIGDTLPTATHFKTGSDSDIRDADSIAFLFASVDGISKVGSYTGSSSTVTVTTGFQPRFVIIRRVEADEEWVVLDTLRGWGSGNDAFLHPNNTSAQNSNMDLGAPTSTGFTVTTTYNTLNTNGENFIYYAHA